MIDDASPGASPYERLWPSGSRCSRFEVAGKSLLSCWGLLAHVSWFSWWCGRGWDSLGSSWGGDRWISCFPIFQIWIIYFCPLGRTWSLDLIPLIFNDIPSANRLVNQSKINIIINMVSIIYQCLHLPGMGVEAKRGARPPCCHKVVVNLVTCLSPCHLCHFSPCHLCHFSPCHLCHFSLCHICHPLNFVTFSV